MKKTGKDKMLLLLLPFLSVLFIQRVAAQEDSVVSKEIIRLKYFNDNNSVQFLALEYSLKTGKKIEPLKNKSFQIYLDSNKAEDLIAKVTTDNSGKANAFLPPSLGGMWNANSLHRFIAVAEGKEDPAIEVEISKARIKIDTSSGEESKSVAVEVMKYENGEWVPAAGVEMKIGIRRHAGILSAGDEEIYTTDSSGIATVEFKRDSLPGDEKGNIILVAKVEDNDLFGNMLVEKSLPWGVAVKDEGNFFDKRSLWATRIRTPWWLLFMAYSIVIGVWGTIFYLVFQIIKIKKIGTSPEIIHSS
jgi:hypothetical protein